MKSDVKNILDILFGIAFAILFKWRVFAIYNLSKHSSTEVTVFFAGIFAFYLSLRVCRFFLTYYKEQGIFSYGTVTGAAFVSLLIIILLFVHTPKESIDFFYGVLIAWLVGILSIMLLKRRT